MYKKLLHSTLLILLILSSTLFAEDFTKPSYDLRLDKHKYGKIWYDLADTDYEAAYNIGVFYDQKLKDYKQAEFWYKKSWNIKENGNSATNLGYLYEDLKKIELAKKWYMISSNLGNSQGTFNLALLYEKKFDQYNKAIEWYIKNYTLHNNKNAANNLGYLYNTKLQNYKEAQTWYIRAIEREFRLIKKSRTIISLYTQR